MAEQKILEVFLSNQWLVISAFVIFIIGITLCWCGSLMAALTALGNKRWIWGLLTILLGPVTGIPYSFVYKEADYPKSLMIKGFAALVAALLLVGVAWLVT